MQNELVVSSWDITMFLRGLSFNKTSEINSLPGTPPVNFNTTSLDGYLPGLIKTYGKDK